MLWFLPTFFLNLPKSGTRMSRRDILDLRRLAGFRLMTIMDGVEPLRYGLPAPDAISSGSSPGSRSISLSLCPQVRISRLRVYVAG